MYLRRVRVENFRNLLNQEVTLERGVNLLIGSNAQGKTNFLEAIYLLAYGKSFRYARDEELVTFRLSPPKTAIIDGTYVDDNGLQANVKLVITISATGRDKRAFFQEKRLDTLQELQGKLLVVEFLPSDVYLASDEPSERRKFIDNLISVIDPEYRKWLKDYQQLIREKNRLLEELSEGRGDRLLLEGYNEKLAHLGALITERRLSVLNLLSRYVKVILRRYSFLEEVELRYLWSVSGELISVERVPEAKEIRDELSKALQSAVERELRVGYSLLGPHRDSLEFTVRGMKVKHVLSQSQSNVLSLALKMAKAAVLKRSYNRNPVMILDEPFAYMDEDNTNVTLALLSKLDQVIIATNRWEPSLGSWISSALSVRGGAITPYSDALGDGS